MHALKVLGENKINFFLRQKLFLPTSPTPHLPGSLLWLNFAKLEKSSAKETVNGSTIVTGR